MGHPGSGSLMRHVLRISCDGNSHFETPSYRKAQTQGHDGTFVSGHPQFARSMDDDMILSEVLEEVDLVDPLAICLTRKKRRTSVHAAADEDARRRQRTGKSAC